MALQLQQSPSSAPKSTKKLIDLSDADRAFSKTEEEVEASAIKFSIKHYKRIHPYFGTLGHLFRNFNGGNSAVIEIIREKIEHGGNSISNAKKFKEALTLWNVSDEFSKSRVDIFDHICQIVKLERAKFWALFQECLFEFQNLLVEMALTDKKLDLIENIDAFSKKERGIRDRELLSRITGVDKPASLMQINDNSTIVNNNLSIKDSNVGFNFADMIRSGDKVVRGENKNEIEEAEEDIKLLEEGNSDYIDGEIVQNEKEAIEVK
jgi:hypothetical protein